MMRPEAILTLLRQEQAFEKRSKGLLTGGKYHYMVCVTERAGARSGETESSGAGPCYFVEYCPLVAVLCP
jgi:hypothetical protein